MLSNRTRTYSLLFFLSGATGLVYELLWVRLLYESFGSTIQSVTTVVAAYMGGLGLGAWLLGRRADREGRPAALYGRLEIAVGVFGALSPFVLELAREAYIALAGGLGSSGGSSIALRFGLAFLVLLVPTTLMGGTLPVLTRAFAGGRRDDLRGALGWLYGLNTLGAMVGVALAGFFLIEHVGIRASLWATALANVLIGIVAIRQATAADPGGQPGVPGVSRTVPATLRRVALLLLAVTAFAALLDEIAWTRVLVMIVGGSTYAFSLVLLVFLLGIGIGSALVARRAADANDGAATGALAQGVTAAGAALLFIFFSWLPSYIVSVFQIPHLGATGRLALLGVAVGMVVLIPAVGMGMTFPVLTDVAAPPAGGSGAQVGRAYALNTIGSILGAALTGFVLVRALGTERTLRVGLGVNAAAGLLLCYLAARGVAEGSPEHRRLRARVLGGGILAAAGLVTAVGAPSWSARLFDLAPTIYARTPMNAATRRAFLRHAGGRQLSFEEGWNATVSVWESPPGRTLKVNGKADASDHGDMDTQVLLGLAPVAARPDAHSALAIGFGSGVTARVLAETPGMTRVRVVEIEPAVLAASRFFTAVNDTVQAKPNVSVTLDDARSALQLDRNRYDVIASEPSNPWVAGVATLYTPEFFRIVRARLADDGVFGQWVQLYQLPLPIVRGIVANVRSVFPHVQIWFSSPWDLMILGSARPLRYDSAWLARLVGPRGAFDALARDYLAVDAVPDYFGHYLLGDSGVARLLAAPGLVHTDDHPRLEFVAARRFLGDDPGGVFDSLAAIAGKTPADSINPFLLARALSVRPGDASGYPYVEAARRARPAEARWTVAVAAMKLAEGDTGWADTSLARLVPRDPDAALLVARIALARRASPRARALFQGVIAAGGDTAFARAGLAVAAARDSDWRGASAAVRAAMAAARNTFRRPDPRDLVLDALTRIVEDGPPRAADSLVAEVQGQRPGWASLYELRAVAELRAGRCDAAVDQFLTLLDFGIERDDGPALVQRCRQAAER
ncbi:MAG TPA: fused MFS/spermidine synthase [Gemmatimonadales bacterium]|nr:fused MFS/spermidine synthase [Gemmatimonadales bacterium]